MQVRQKQKIDKLLGYFLIGMLWPFTRLLGIVLRRNHDVEKAPRRILFIKLMGLGSLIVATDAITAIRQRFPDTKLILLTDTNIADGIKPFGLFDEIWETNTGNFLTSIGRILHFLFKSWTWRNLWVVDLEVYSKLTTVFALITLARNRFGFFLASVSFRKYLNTHNIPFDQSALLEDNYAGMAKAITGLNDLPIKIPVKRNAEAEKRYIIFNNTCSGLAFVRKLPETILCRICQWTLQNTNYCIAFLGTKEDQDDIDRFIKNDPILVSNAQRVLNYAGASANFDEYYHFLETEGVCLITIDSGPLHIAKKLGLPTLSLWGPTNPEHYLKIHPEEQSRHLTHYLKVACSPCVHRHETLPCGGNNFCMHEMDADKIIMQMQQLLAHLNESSSILRSV